jgi:hypothetical protein
MKGKECCRGLVKTSNLLKEGLYVICQLFYIEHTMRKIVGGQNLEQEISCEMQLLTYKCCKILCLSNDI